MTSEAFIAVGIVIVYLSALNLWIRSKSKLKEQSLDEFAVGGRSFKWYMVIFTVLGTWFTGSCFTGSFGFAAVTGAFALYDTTQVLGGLVLLYIIAPRVWKWGKVHNLYNLPDFVEMRYKSDKLALFIAVFGLIANLPWHVMAFRTFGYVFQALTYDAIPFNLGMILAAVFIMSYVLYGGQKSVVYSDFIQGQMMTIGAVVVMIYIVNKFFGGFGPMLRQVAEKTPEILVVSDVPYWSSVIMAGIIGSYCWMELFNRMFVAESEKDIKLVTAGAPLIGASMYVTLLVLGIGASLIPEVAANPEGGFLTMARMAGGPVLLSLAGIIVIAAEMSSIDSQLATNSMVVANNIVRKFHKDLTERDILKIGRITVIVSLVIALTVSMMDLPMLQEIAIFTFQHIVHIFPTAIIGVLWSRGTSLAAWLGMAVGLPITAFFTLNSELAATMFGSWTPGIIGFSINLLIYITVSLLSKPDDYVKGLFKQLNG